MPRPDLAEVLLGRRETFAKGTRKRSTANLTRAQRVALAPAPPRSAAVSYLRALRKILAATQEQIRAAVYPLLVETQGAMSAPDPKDAQAGTRTDAQSDTWETRWGALRVAIQRETSEEKLRVLLEETLGLVDKTNKAELGRILRIDLSKDTSLASFRAAFLRENVQLIQSISFTQLDKVREQVATAQATGMRVEKLAASIEQTFNVTGSRAALIARDQTLKANADLAQLRQQRVGVTEYVWSCSKDERVRGRPGGKYPNPTKTGREISDHWALDGTVQSWINPPVTNQATGARNHPGRDFQCRCVAIPKVDTLLEGL